MVEQEAVNFEVTGSSPVRGAKSELKAANAVFFVLICPKIRVILANRDRCGKIKEVFKHKIGWLYLVL